MKEDKPTGIVNHPDSKDFSSELKPGAEMEIMLPLSRVFEIGVQLGYDQYAGYTPTAPLYNFFLSKYNPMPDSYIYPHEALVYDTQVLKILGTGRWYFIPFARRINIFMKYFGGVAFTGTDFTFDNPIHSVNYGVGVLYSSGTKNSDRPKDFGITGGAGLGALYRLSDRFDICFDASASLIHSDIVNGVPNYNFVQREGVNRMERVGALSAVVQGSIGLIYSAIPDRRMNKNNITRSSSLNRNKFIKSKSKKSFSRNYKKRR